MRTQSAEDGNDPEAPTKLYMLENEIDEKTYKASIDPEIHLLYADKTEHDNAWQTYREMTTIIENLRELSLLMVMGQYRQVL